ncbi:hypothetical protein GLOIN_2v1765644 [Rhizophagus irregularis DAOM 181602=DAOM 197198]|nr:hypothetical protein GLOIN_2v1765644 [Rhizophagus irregularis DAOM 181602=DAOM 197198]
MTCSKIFSGDLPELTEEIIQYFRKDFSTLYSCILINRLWCRLAIPLLWEDPFSKKYPENHHFIEIYLSKLNEDVKTKLYLYGVNNDLVSSNTLFNYPSFIKYLDIDKILNSIQTWVDTLVVNILQEAFDQLNVLESIHLIYCHSLNSDFVQQIIKVNKPFKLRSLFMNEILHIESLQLLLEKFSDCLENFGFESKEDKNNEPKRQLFKLIMKYCTKIRYFDSGIPDDNNIYLFIENNQNNINYLTIEFDIYDDYCCTPNYVEYSSTVLQNLGQVLPPKLEYLNLSLLFNTSDLEYF